MDDSIVLKLLNLLETLTEERGVPKKKDIVNKNINPVENSTLETGEPKKSKGDLSSNEKSKLIATFTLFNKMFFDYKSKLDEEKPDKPLIQTIVHNHKKPELPVEKKEGKGFLGSLGMMGMIVTGLGLFVASVFGLGAALSGVFGNITGAVEVIGKLGLFGALKSLKKTFLKKFAVAALKKLPFIGGLINLGFGVKDLLAGNTYLGIAELISGVINFIPVIGPALSIGADILIAMAESKGMFSEGGLLSPENGWNTIKGWMVSIGKTIWDNALYIPVLGTFKRFGMAGDAIGSGNFGEGMLQIGLGLVSLFPGGGLLIKGVEMLAGWMGKKAAEGAFTPVTNFLGKIKKWITNKLSALPEGLKNALSWLGIIDDDTTPIPITVGADESKKASEKMITQIQGVWDITTDSMGNSVMYMDKKATEIQQNAQKNIDKLKVNNPTKPLEAPKEVVKPIEPPKSESATSITDSIFGSTSGIGGDLMNVFKGVSTHLMSSISGAVTPKTDELEDTQATTVKSQINNEQELTKQVDTTSKETPPVPEKKSTIKDLADLSVQQVGILRQLSTIGMASLQELKRISGNPSGGSIVLPPIPQTSKSTPQVTIPDNRDAYYSSPYALA